MQKLLTGHLTPVPDLNAKAPDDVDASLDHGEGYIEGDEEED